MGRDEGEEKMEIEFYLDGRWHRGQLVEERGAGVLVFFGAPSAPLAGVPVTRTYLIEVPRSSVRTAR